MEVGQRLFGSLLTSKQKIVILN